MLIVANGMNHSDTIPVAPSYAIWPLIWGGYAAAIAGAGEKGNLPHQKSEGGLPQAGDPTGGNAAQVADPTKGGIKGMYKQMGKQAMIKALTPGMDWSWSTAKREQAQEAMSRPLRQQIQAQQAQLMRQQLASGSGPSGSAVEQQQALAGSGAEAVAQTAGMVSQQAEAEGARARAENLAIAQSIGSQVYEAQVRGEQMAFEKLMAQYGSSGGGGGGGGGGGMDPSSFMGGGEGATATGTAIPAAV